MRWTTAFRIPGRNPEQNIAFRQKIELMRSILHGLGDRDREILTRFYIYEQTQEQICQDLRSPIRSFGS